MGADPRLLATPIVLRTSVALPAVAGLTSPVSFDQTKLQNTLRVPIEITEILVTCQGDRYANATLMLNARPGAAVELALGVGQYRMTDGYTPFRSLAPWNYGEDNVWESVTVALGGGQTDMIGFSQRRIVLPEPIRLRPNVGFVATARRNPPAPVVTVPTGIETVSIALIGRVDPGGPNVPTAQAIPFWSSYDFVQAAINTAEVVTTPETALRNPLTVPLDVERIIVSEGAFTTVEAYIPFSAAVQHVGAISVRWPNGEVLVDESHGFDRIDPAGFVHREHALAAKFQIPPYGRVVTAVEFGAGGAVGYATAVSIFGTRREVL